MTRYAAPLDDIRFALDVAGLDAVAALPGLEAAGPDVVDAVLDAAARFAQAELAPLNAVADRQGARLDGGRVRTPPGFAEALAAYGADGWIGTAFPRAHGGQDLPWLLAAALSDIWNGAGVAFELCPLLTRGAIEAILHHGSEAQRRLYLPRLIDGSWSAAMCLTEAQAGSDLSTIRTRAEPAGDGWRLFGEKIYISYGEHEMVANIVHLVLARLPEAPEGVRGLSLFVVPKFLPGADGAALGARNGWRCTKVEGKLGLHGSPTCAIAYEGASGFLLGRAGEGIRCMFTMMNNARLAVGHEGLGLAERAFQAALAYARERVQGRRDGRPVPIVEHGDVRRMLVGMRAQVAAMRALAYWAAAWVDRAAREPDEAARRRAAGRVALLTPMVKAWCTDEAQTIARAAIQVHGGIGFIEAAGVAQHLRDAIVLSIYEGTNGIQALDLAGRKLGLDDGRLPLDLLDELRAGLDAVPAELRDGLARALDTLEAATRALQGRPEAARQGDAVPYLRLFAATLGGCLLARGAARARATRGTDWPGLARHFLRHLLPPALASAGPILAGGNDPDGSLLPG